MKTVAIFCPYSAPSACGIWKRVWNDAQALRDAGYEVHVFSTNRIKGTDQTSSKEETIENIQIHRFPVLLSIGGTAQIWVPLRKLIKINPHIIHVHGYRHPHSLWGLLWGKFRRKQVILTTHAPFKKDPRRSFYLKLMDIAYDIIFGWWELRLYDQVVKISQWETASLARRGRKHAEYIPNGIEEVFFNADHRFHTKPTKRIIYMGRLDPVKRVEWLVQAAEKQSDKHFVLYGPLHGYVMGNGKIGKWDIGNNLEIIDKKYNAQEFIHWVGKSDMYVLPSIREALGITLLEAMALGKIVITSKALGPSDFVEHGINGFIVNSVEELSAKITEVYSNWNEMKEVSQNARKTAEKYSAERLGRKLVEMYEGLE